MVGMDISRPALEAWFSEAPASIRHDLGGTMVPADMARLRPLLDAERWDARYAPTRGTRGLRARIAQLEGLDEEELVLACGATEAGVAALLATARPATAAVLQDPLYYLFEPWLGILGVEIRRWGARPDGRWHLADAEALLDSTVHLFVVNSPHNPTGQVLALAELARLVDTRGDLTLLVDEVYRGVADDGLACAARLSDRVVAVNSASKRWGMPGLRLGWVACRDAAIRQRVLSWHEHLAHSPPRPSEEALAALWPALEGELARSRSIAARNRGRVERWLQRHVSDFAGCLPDAGVTMLLNCPPELTDISLAHRARDRGVFVVPGSALGYPDRIRIGFGHRDPEALEAALEALAAIIRATESVPRGELAR